MSTKLRVLSTILAGMLGVSLAVADEASLASDEPVSKEKLIELFKPSTDDAAGATGKTRNIRVKRPGESSLAPSEPKSYTVRVDFGYNSDSLTEHAQGLLKPIGEALASQELSSVTFVLEGHTDSAGSSRYNKKLSERRAAAVKNFLVSQYGIAADRVSAVGKGEQEPLDTANPESAINRRVKIIAKQ